MAPVAQWKHGLALRVVIQLRFVRSVQPERHLMLRKSLTILLSLPLLVMGISSATATAPLVVTFEADDNSGFIHIDFDDDVLLPGHQKSTVVDGVDGVGGKVLKVVRGTASWAGTTIIKDGTKTLIKTGSLFVTAKVKSPAAGKKLMMKIDCKDNTVQSVETYATESTVTGWHEYTFDFSVQRVGTEAFSAAKPATMASIFFDFTTTPTASTAGQTYYLDDVTFASATAGTGGGGGGGETVVAAATPTVLNYEAGDTLGALGAAEANPSHPVGIFAGGTAAIEAAPQGVGGAGNHVLALTKTGAAWTGYNSIVDVDGSLRITNAEFPKVTFNYLSPKGNSPVGIQLFIGETKEVEMIQNADLGANTLTFDFSKSSNWTFGSWSASKIYTKLVIFPDFLVAVSTPADVYYFDNVAINGAVTPGTSVKPANVVATKISNKTFKVGTTLSSVKGTWVGTGSISYKYSWYRCTTKGATTSNAKPVAANKCSVIARQTSSKYKVTKADKGKYVRVLVTAKNSVGTTYSLSKSTSGKVS